MRHGLLSAATVMAATFALVAPPASASHGQFSIFEAPRELTGQDDALRQATLEEIASFGVMHIRVLVNWQRVVVKPNARKKPAGFDTADPTSSGYDWAVYDQLFLEAKARGIDVIATLTGPAPSWAAKHHILRPDRDEFARFVQAASTRYGEQVNMWTVWNEPNLSSFLGPQFIDGKPYSPLLYRNLYQAAIQGLNASGNGGDQVLSGETAPRGNAGRAVAPVTFAKVFLTGKKLPMTGYATHPYTTSTGPFAIPKEKATVSISVLDRLTDVLNAKGYRKAGLYLTEFGIQSAPDDIVGVSQTKQNDYRNYSEKIAYDNPRVKAFSQYLMRDDFSVGDGFQSGLRLADGTEKLAYTGYQLPVVATRAGTKVRLWGLVRAGGVPTLTVQQRDRHGWKDLGTTSTDSRGYWSRAASFKRGRRFRVKVGDSVSPPATID